MDRWEQTVKMLSVFATKLERWPKTYEWDNYAKENKLAHTKTIRTKLKKSWEEIGKELGFKVIRKKKEGKKSPGKGIVLENKEIFRLYKEGWYIHEIGEKMNCSAETIRKRLKANGIETSSRKRRENSQKRTDILNEEVKRLYVEEKWSTLKIAEKYNTSKALILRRLSDMGINRRRYNDYPLVDRDFLLKYYQEKRLSSREVAELAGCNFKVILKRLKHYGITIRTEMGDFTLEERKDKFGRKKEKHGLWKGGVTPIRNLVRNRLSFLSKEVFIRDNFECKVCCNKSELHAHHLRPFADIMDEIIEENGRPDFQIESNRLKFVEICERDKRLLDMDNLITLCEKCHKNEHAENPVTVIHYDILEKEWREFVETNYLKMSVSKMGVKLGILPYRIIRYMKSNGIPFAYENEEWLRENLKTKRYSEIAKEFHSRHFPCKAQIIKDAAINLGIVKDNSEEILNLYEEEGIAIKTIAKRLRVSPGYVGDVLVKNGVHLTEIEDVEEAEEEICSLFSKGITIESIVKQLDLPRKGVRRILLRNGFNTSSNRMVRHS